MSDFINKIFNSCCLHGLKTLPDNSIDCCVTSPPYYNLRNYGVAGQIGLEKTPREYITRLVEVFMEVVVFFYRVSFLSKKSRFVFAKSRVSFCAIYIPGL